MSIKQLPNGNWKADFWLGTSRRRITGSNKKLVEQEMTKLKHLYNQGQLVPKTAANSLTFGQITDDYVKLYLIPNGREVRWFHLEDLKKFFGADTHVMDIQPSRVKEWRSMMLESHPMVTVKRYYVDVRGIFREAEERLKYNPCNGLFRRQWKKCNNPRQRWFTDEETQKIYDHILNVEKDEEKLIYATLARNTGFRENNLTRLEWVDVNFANKTIRARDPKNDESYSVDLNPAAEAAVKRLWNMKGHPSIGLCFRQGKSISYWNNQFKDTFQALGWWRTELTRQHRATLHTFRHTLASRLVSAGYNDRTVMAIMGWKNPEPLKTYAHLAPDTKRMALVGVSLGMQTLAKEMV